MTKNIFTTFYAVDQSIHQDAVALLSMDVLRQWYGGEAEPDFIKKIPELRNHPLTAQEHRARVAKSLPDFGILDHKIYSDYDDEEDVPLGDEIPVYALGRIYPTCEITLFFAGPLIQIKVRATAKDMQFSAKDIADTTAKVNEAINNLKSSGNYTFIQFDAHNTPCDDPLLALHTRIKRANRAENLFSFSKKNGKKLFWGAQVIVAIALILFFQYALKNSNIISNVDLNQSYTLMVDRKDNAARRSIMPDFKAYGTIIETGEKVAVDLYLNEFNTTDRGYQLRVLKRDDPESPYMLAWYVEKHSPIKIGGINITVDFLIWGGLFAAWLMILYRYIQSPNERLRTDIAKSFLHVIVMIGGIAVFASVMVWFRGL